MGSNTKKIKLLDDFSFEMAYVAEGSFLMGDDQSEYKSEKPVRKVQVSTFYMDKYQVTQELWEAVMGNNPSRFKGKKRPVEQVSWEEIQDFIKKVNQLTGLEFRLPTESEWEYAARGGIYSQGYVYAGSDKLRQVGWYDENSNEGTHEVGQLLANELGLYDMSGNVFEWCEDDYHDSYKNAPSDGKAWIDSPDRGADRVMRGGSYFDGAVSCRPADRSGGGPTLRDSAIGFRLAMSFQSVG